MKDSGLFAYIALVTNQLRMDNIQEIWKDVVGFEGIYQVSDQGRVRRIAPRSRGSRCKSKDGIVSHSLDTWGYPKLLLSHNGSQTPRRIHRLVAQAFIENPDNKPTVNHKNRNKLDNRAENLEWATQQEQSDHKTKTNDLYISLSNSIL